MDSNNQELRELQRQTARRKQLEVMLRDLLGQKRELMWTAWRAAVWRGFSTM